MSARSAAGHEPLVCFNFYVGWRCIQALYGSILRNDLLSPQRLYILNLCRDGEVTVSELASGLHIDTQAISNILRRMERDGLVARRRDTHDRRVVKVEATERGRRLHLETEAAVASVDRMIEGHLVPEDARALQRIVARLEILAGDSAVPA